MREELTKFDAFYAAALKATPGFDAATGVGTPAGYILAVRGL